MPIWLPARSGKNCRLRSRGFTDVGGEVLPLCSMRMVANTTKAKSVTRKRKWKLRERERERVMCSEVNCYGLPWQLLRLDVAFVALAVWVSDVGMFASYVS